jgi:Flp pilus assembly protein TadG
MNKRITYHMMNQTGAVLIKFVLFLPVLIGMVALAFDVAQIAVAKNELQNAADAGALAAARFLYNDLGTEVNTGANQIGYDAATANKSQNTPVEVNWNGGNDGDVQRGHWSFGMGGQPRGFTKNGSTVPVSLWGVTTEELDADLNFINAVRVTARREATPLMFYFAKIFGVQNWSINASAVAYIGFSGTLDPGEVDLPIAICKQSLTGDPSDGCESTTAYECNIGYMLSDGLDKNTAAWTNFSQPCETASTTSMRDLLTCGDANTDPIALGKYMGATNGVVDTLINSPMNPSLVNCWKSAGLDTDGDGWPDQPWNRTLPVVNCPNSHVSNCMESCGAVNVNIVWIIEKENNIDEDAPRKMFHPNGDLLTNDSADGGTRWNSFVDAFGLRDPHGQLAYYTEDPSDTDGFKKKSIYFLPDCAPHEIKGDTGGQNFGVLAKVPVLVD